MNWTEAQIDEVVAQVVKSLSELGSVPNKTWDATQYCSRKFIGVFEKMEDAIDAASAGYKAVRAMSLAEREKIISVIRDLCRKEAPVMASLCVSETKM